VTATTAVQADEICHPDVAFHWGELGDARGVDGLAALEEAARAAFPGSSPRWSSSRCCFRSGRRGGRGYFERARW
jgi:hypothetical protein